MTEVRDPNGLVSLGERVQMLEKRVKKQEKQMKRRGCGEEDHYLRYVNKPIVIWNERGGKKEAFLKEVGRYTVLIEDRHGEHIVNKMHIYKMSPGQAF